MITIAYSGRSSPTAFKLAEEGDIGLVRRSLPEVDVNWGRNRANSKLNPDISNVTNKRVMRELFAEHGVPMPRLITEPEAYSGYPFIGRSEQHMKGRGLWLIRSHEDVRRAKLGTRKKRPATHFMEYVEAEREYRVHIFKGKSIRISEKGYTDETKKEYTTRKPGDIKLRRVREAAKLAVEAVSLDFGAVDVLARGPNNEDVFVLEVNAAPGLGGSMPRLYADTFRQWKEEQA
jgi:glutathione synthase/RimK-type ligase-like ATP-grasp enzyme